jgi:hypothetical protein
MDIAVSDPRVRFFTTTATTLSFVALAALGMLPGLVWWYTGGGVFDEPEILTAIRVRLFEFSQTGLAADAASVLAYGLPALVTALCFRRDVRDRLSGFGVFLLVLLALAGSAALVSTILVSAPASEWGQDIDGGVAAAKWLQDTGSAVVRLFATYLALFIGLRLPGASQGESEHE